MCQSSSSTIARAKAAGTQPSISQSPITSLQLCCTSIRWVREHSGLRFCQLWDFFQGIFFFFFFYISRSCSPGSCHLSITGILGQVILFCFQSLTGSHRHGWVQGHSIHPQRSASGCFPVLGNAPSGSFQ